MIANNEKPGNNILTINGLPVRTWNRLKLNDVTVTLPDEVKPCEYAEEIPDGLDRVKGKSIGPMSDIKIATGFGDEFEQYISDTSVTTAGYITEENKTYDRPLRQKYIYGASSGADGADTAVTGSLNALDFTVSEGSSLTVVQEVSGHTSQALVRNICRLGKNASLTLVQIQRLTDDTRFYNDIGVYAEDGAEFNLIQLILGSGNSYYGLKCALSGTGSKLSTNIAYSLDGERTLDMNYVADHTGKRTESDISVRGVLKGSAKKLFRGSIDFHKGCAGAKGAEIENVLLIDDSVTNQTIPLILCDEEDVEGAHGATIGRIDESLLFYMRSRGISQEQAYALMEQAQIDSVYNLIDEGLVEHESVE